MRIPRLQSDGVSTTALVGGRNGVPRRGGMAADPRRRVDEGPGQELLFRAPGSPALGQRIATVILINGF